jgi:hypothetical protein
VLEGGAADESGTPTVPPPADAAEPGN